MDSTIGIVCKDLSKDVFALRDIFHDKVLCNYTYSAHGRNDLKSHHDVLYSISPYSHYLTVQFGYKDTVRILYAFFSMISSDSFKQDYSFLADEKEFTIFSIGNHTDSESIIKDILNQFPNEKRYFRQSSYTEHIKL